MAEKNPSELLNTTGYNSGDGFFGKISFNNLLGIDEKNGFHEEFYTNLLNSAQCPPINALWLVFINGMPTKGIAGKDQTYTEKDNATEFTEEGYNIASKMANGARGILIAQGVKHTGDGTNFTRQGYSNTGLFKGVLSNGRSEINTLDISFLESNVSFVDYALRPWAISVAHNGLTDPLVYANTIEVWHLSKMGANTNLATRKIFTYHNCFPINIDQQEYNYGGDDVKVQRQVSFGYHYYTMKDPEEAVIKLIENDSKDKGFVSGLLDNLAGKLKSQFGANSVEQYLSNIVDRAKSFATSAITNTATGAVTNISGAVQGAVDGAIRDVTSTGFKVGNDAVSSIANAANNAVNSIVGSNPNKDTSKFSGSAGSTVTNARVGSTEESASKDRLESYGYIEKTINTDDSPMHLLPLVDSEDIPQAIVDVNVQINPNDSPNHVTKDVTELAEGGITINRTVNDGDPNADTPKFLNSGSDLLYYVEKNISEDDSNPSQSVDANLKSNSTFNSAVERASDSNISAVENALEVTLEDVSGDSVIGDNIPTYVEKEVEYSDSNPSQSVNFESKQINKNDSNPSQSVNIINKTNNKNDSL